MYRPTRIIVTPVVRHYAVPGIKLVFSGRTTCVGFFGFVLPFFFLSVFWFFKTVFLCVAPGCPETH